MFNGNILNSAAESPRLRAATIAVITTLSLSACVESSPDSTPEAANTYEVEVDNLSTLLTEGYDRPAIRDIENTGMRSPDSSPEEGDRIVITLDLIHTPEAQELLDQGDISLDPAVEVFAAPVNSDREVSVIEEWVKAEEPIEKDEAFDGTAVIAISPLLDTTHEGAELALVAEQFGSIEKEDGPAATYVGYNHLGSIRRQLGAWIIDGNVTSQVDGLPLPTLIDLHHEQDGLPEVITPER